MKDEETPMPWSRPKQPAYNHEQFQHNLAYNQGPVSRTQPPFSQPGRPVHSAGPYRQFQSERREGKMC